jgi:hypothetical protein
MNSPARAKFAKRKVTPLPDFIPPQLCTSFDRPHRRGT